MRHKRSHRRRYNSFGFIIGMATIVIMLLAINYFLETDNIDNNPIIYEKLLTDSSYYTKSEIPDWHKINVGPFYIHAPQEYKYYRLRGIDSYIGGITNQIDTIEFDYGRYSNPLNDCVPPEFRIQNELVNGIEFKIVKASDGKGYAAAFTESLGKDRKLWIGCINSSKKLDEIIKIIKTIEFK